MAYDKHTWTCNEPITVERLNHIEDGIAAGGDCDCGYECTETVTTLTEESVTTVAQGEYNFGQLSYSQEINADTIVVTFNGVEYECPLVDLDGSNGYGGWNISTGELDFSNYPFALISEFDGDDVGNTLATATAGTHTIKIEVVGDLTVTTTPCFEKAVQSIVSPLVVTATLQPGEATTQSPSYLDASIEEIMEAMTTRGVVIQDPRGVVYSVLSVNWSTLTIGTGFYDSTTQQTDFEAYAYSVTNDQLRYPPQPAH